MSKTYKDKFQRIHKQSDYANFIQSYFSSIPCDNRFFLTIILANRNSK